MLIHIMKSKIHRVKITQANVDYMGSITIDSVLMNAANIVAGEKVQVLNVSNGERLETYVIPGDTVGEIGINGPAALKMRINDIIIIVSYAMVNQNEAKIYKPTILFPNETNNSILE
ncbi:MAG: aspartate 1-decarboxylase [Flavobacteriales bacterium]|jgi:aspartate 1-decarboxylase|nr:aspartate 1-decarboxylase [Flavobacteriales bacterium]